MVSQERGFSKTTTTDSTGRYRFSELQPGRYDVTATLSGFGTVTTTNNLIENNKKTDITTTMKLSAQQADDHASRAKSRSWTSPTRRSRRASASKEFEKMPQGRSYQSLFLNAPGRQPDAGTNPNPSVHGALDGNNLWLYDGVDVTDPTTGTFGGEPQLRGDPGGHRHHLRRLGRVRPRGGRRHQRHHQVRHEPVRRLLQSRHDERQVERAEHDDGTSARRRRRARIRRWRVRYSTTSTRVYAVTLGGPYLAGPHLVLRRLRVGQRHDAAQSTPVSGENYQQIRRTRFWDAKLTAQISLAASILRARLELTDERVHRQLRPSSAARASVVAATPARTRRVAVYAGFLTGCSAPT